MKIKDKENAFIFLKEQGLLEYGTIIPAEVFEYILKFPVVDNWKFLGPFLEMKQFIEENGFLCTTENMELGCLRIFDTDEIAVRADRIFNNVTNRLKRLQSCLTNTKTEEFNKKDFIKHLHSSTKINAGLQALTSSLNNI